MRRHVERALTSPLLMRATWAATTAVGHVSTGLSAPLAARLWFTPWQLPVGKRAREREAEWLTGTQPLTIRWRDQTLRGYVTGDGPTALLVHGWGSRGSAMGGLAGPLRDAGLRVAAVDLPGHGQTGGLEANAYVMADALLEAARELEAQIVVAHSFGSLVLLDAIRRGLRVDRVVMIAPTVRLEHAVATFGIEFGVPGPALEGLRTAIERRFGDGVWDEFSMDRASSDLDMPVLIVHDSDDARVAIRDAELLRDRLFQAELVVTSGLGHHRILRDPAVISRAVAFLTRESEHGGPDAVGVGRRAEVVDG